MTRKTCPDCKGVGVTRSATKRVKVKTHKGHQKRTRAAKIKCETCNGVGSVEAKSK